MNDSIPNFFGANRLLTPPHSHLTVRIILLLLLVDRHALTVAVIEVLIHFMRRCALDLLLRCDSLEAAQVDLVVLDLVLRRYS